MRAADEGEYLRLDRYYTELIVEPDSTWIGQSLKDFQKRFQERMSIVEWLRGGVRHRGMGDAATLETGDVLLVRATPEEIVSIAKEPGLALHAIAKYGEPTNDKESSAPEDDAQLVQVVVAPHSPFAGRTVGSIDFLKTLGVIVVGLWRKEGWMREEISQMRLREGDLLVLWGTPRTFAELATHRGFLMMVPFAAKERRRHRAVLATLIVAGVIALAASGAVPAQIAFLAGAVALIATGCVGVEQAYREIDVRIFVMIAGVIPLGAAMEKTGTAQLLAEHLQAFTGGMEPVRRDARALLGGRPADADSFRLGHRGPARACVAGSCARAGPAASAIRGLHGARRRRGVPHPHRSSRQPAHPQPGSVHVR